VKLGEMSRFRAAGPNSTGFDSPARFAKLLAHRGGAVSGAGNAATAARHMTRHKSASDITPEADCEPQEGERQRLEKIYDAQI